jgi:ribose transport system ATP-binding protein
MNPLLRMLGLTKRYPGVIALDDVSMDVHAGEVVALVGENGAGKSTLVNILAGALQPDGGSIAIAGIPATLHSPADAHRLGIAVIHQDLRLVPGLSVAGNILLGLEPVTGLLRTIDTNAMRTAANAALARIECSLPADAPVSSLPHAQQQLVAIARALALNPRILALDEPTAALSGRETEHLFVLLRVLRAAGVGIVYISHRLEEVFAIADRIVVLRDGTLAGDAPASSLDRARLIALMVGRDLGSEFPEPSRTTGEEILRLDALNGPGVRNVSLTLHRGEVLGLGGLVGAGRSELANLIFGAVPVDSGRMFLDGHSFHPRSPADAIGAGIGLLTEDRNTFGLILGMNVRENMTLPNLRRFARGLFINTREESAAAEELGRRLHIKTPTVEQEIAALSGGNRQKVVLGRWLMSDARILIFDEPTTGIDVGARREIYEIIQRLARTGLGILIISSDLPELLGLCTRITVMSGGEVTGTLGRDDATQEAVMELATPRRGSQS